MLFIPAKIEKADDSPGALLQRSAWREKLLAITLYSSFCAVMVGWLLLLGFGLYWLM